MESNNSNSLSSETQEAPRRENTAQRGSFHSWKSRTFQITLFWNILVVFGVILNAMGLSIPIETVITMAGTISLAYVGGEKARDSFIASRGDR